MPVIALQAVVEVNEEGTVAAAATAVNISQRSSRNQTVEVRADHPFLYAIRDTLTNTWLFMGKYSAQ
jgi:serpin B